MFVAAVGREACRKVVDISIKHHDDPFPEVNNALPSIICRSLFPFRHLP